MRLKDKARLLLEDPSIRRWIDNLNSASSKRIYLEALAKYCDYRGLDPHRIVDEFKANRQRAEDRLEDFIIDAKKKYAPKVVHNLLVGIRSWLKHNDIEVVRKINVGNVRLTPTIEDERPPSQDELRRILGFADLRAKACIALLAFAGLRPITVAGLKIKDFPEMKIEDGKVSFVKIPTMVKVRAALSKNGRQYFTFLIKEGCEYLKDYLESRLKAGERLNGESYVITHGSRARIKTFSRKAVQRMVKRVFKKAGFPFRPYVLRSYFATAIDNVRTIPFTHQQFFMGHSGPVEMTYTVHKRLPEWQVEEMRREFLDMERYLSTTGAPSRMPEDERKKLVLETLRAVASSLGVDPMRVRIELAEEKGDVSVEDEIEAIKDRIKRFTARMELKEDPVQRIIEPDELEGYLSKGWSYVDQLNDGRIVVKRAI